VSSCPRVASRSLGSVYHSHWRSIRCWAGGHRTTALSLLPDFHPCAPIREKDLDEPDPEVCNCPGILPRRFPVVSLRRSHSALRQLVSLPCLGGQESHICRDRGGAPSCAAGAPSTGVHSRLLVVVQFDRSPYLLLDPNHTESNLFAQTLRVFLTRLFRLFLCLERFRQRRQLTTDVFKKQPSLNCFGHFKLIARRWGDGNRTRVQSSGSFYSLRRSYYQ